MSADHGAKLNVLAPRGAAKSTIAALAYPLREALEQREPYIWILSDTRHQAHAHHDAKGDEVVLPAHEVSASGAPQHDADGHHVPAHGDARGGASGAGNDKAEPAGVPANPGKAAAQKAQAEREHGK